jgi:hypothetical protein
MREYFHLILKNSNFIAYFVTDLPTEIKSEQVGTGTQLFIERV